MTFGSVCSGIEAASVAWEPLGWRCAWTAEIDPAACAVLAHRVPDVPNRGDFTNIGAEDGANVDLLVGGTPCQDFSVAGLRKGLDGERGLLTIEFLRLLGRIRPRWVVWENVPGVLSIDGGRAFGTFLWLLGQLGYGFAYRVLDAQYFGVPQRRRRVFVVGHLGDWRRAAAVLLERESLCGHPPPGREAGQGVADSLEASLGRRNGQPSCGGRDGHLIARSQTSRNCRNDGDSDNFVAHTLHADGFDASEDGTGRGTPLVPVPFDTTQITSAGNYSSPRAGDPCHPLAAGAHPPAIAFNWQTGGDGWLGFGTKPTALHAGQTPAVLSMGVRRLTPREAERLQGFPDDWTLVPYRGKPMADRPRYRLLGNSMAVPCMSWIGRRIAEASTPLFDTLAEGAYPCSRPSGPSSPSTSSPRA